MSISLARIANSLYEGHRASDSEERRTFDDYRKHRTLIASQIVYESSFVRRDSLAIGKCSNVERLANGSEQCIRGESVSKYVALLCKTLLFLPAHLHQASLLVSLMSRRGFWPGSFQRFSVLTYYKSSPSPGR